MTDVLEKGKTNPKRRKLLFYLFFAGIALVIIGFGYDIVYASIPYQDPPPELTRKYDLNKTISDVIIDSGLVLIMLGMVGAVMQK